MRRLTWCALGFLIGLAVPAAAQLRSETVAMGLRNPVAIVADPTDQAVLLVAEQDGLVRVVRGGGLLATPFLDLRNEVLSGGERGLLGLALAPDYAVSRRFFVNFTNRNGDTVVARFRRHPADPAITDPATRFDLVWPGLQRFIEQPFSNHNGGHLAFGPDGYLYIGMGDGGSAGDPSHRAQNPQSLLGKMLRIDINVADDDPRGYRIPADNPFVDSQPIQALGEIWAFGLRNPWRYSFDDWTRGGTGALTIGDVGQNAREEINFQPAGLGGRNYGWRLREGHQIFDERAAPAYLPLVKPLHDYGRAIGSSVTGGLVYRGSALPPGFHGRYFLADFATGRVFSLALHVERATGKAVMHDEREHTASLGGTATLGQISSFGTDYSGEMLLLNYASGRILRIAPDLANLPLAPAIGGGVVRPGEIEIRWRAASTGVPADGFLIERLRSGAVVERHTVSGSTVRITGLPADCIRVRGIAPSRAAGPPSEAVCMP